MAGISKKLRTCGLSNLIDSILFSASAHLVQSISNYRLTGNELPELCLFNRVFGLMLEAHRLEWLQEKTIDEPSSNKQLLVSLYRWSQQFDSGLQNKTITSLRSLFLPLLMTTVLLGSVSMPLSAFGSPDSIIPLCIGIFLNVQLVIESPSFARLTASHRPTSNAFSFDYIVVLPH